MVRVWQQKWVRFCSKRVQQKEFFIRDTALFPYGIFLSLLVTWMVGYPPKEQNSYDGQAKLFQPWQYGRVLWRKNWIQKLSNFDTPLFLQVNFCCCQNQIHAICIVLLGEQTITTVSSRDVEPESESWSRSWSRACFWAKGVGVVKQSTDSDSCCVHEYSIPYVGNLPQLIRP